LRIILFSNIQDVTGLFSM